jgi:hypothetical protein
MGANLTGNAAYSFEPMKVAVRTADRSRLPPSAYVGPGIFWAGDAWNGVPRGCFARDRRPDLELPRRLEDQRHAIPRDSCFVLVFATQVTGTAEVELAGLTRGAEPLSFPPIRFFRRAATDFLITQRPSALEADDASPLSP